jgi:Domain of unknown function (DUF6321)/Domain of unknown function (DUF305)
VKDSLTAEEHEFLVDMIEHHQMGVVMSNEVLKTTDDDDIMFMAFSIIYQQKNEIETMKEMLKMRSKKNGKANEEKSAKPLRDPKGGLTAAGRAHFNRTEGSNLKPGVKGPADTPNKMRRKGSFLTRFFTNPSGPMKDEKGRPTRLALSAAAWGEPVPQNTDDARELAAKGKRMLERYKNSKDKD